VTASAAFLVRPQVPGGFGEDAELDRRPDGHMVVRKMHFEFGYPDAEIDDLFTTYPSYFVTPRLATALLAGGYTGFALRDDLKVTMDEQIPLLLPDWKPPEVRWLDVVGRPGVDDLGLTTDTSLVVSRPVLDLLRTFRIDGGDVEPWASGEASADATAGAPNVADRGDRAGSGV
jgi:hypothetical protein